MKKRKITVIIEASSTGFGAFTEDDFPCITGYANTVPKVKADFQEAIKGYLEMDHEEGVNDPRLNNGELEFVYKYDLESIFAHFGMLEITAFARRVGMNESLMRQYKAGLAKASDKQKKKIEDGLHELGRELQSARLVYKKKK
ncbi:pilus assembly protein HicB [Chitinophaga alhagiae]|uniref:pilus assembly protein HicB n=1 Tax=Chitinophaga alhagiae TaxID=2203219 RepID=UPI000E5B140A|nr:pilus assembly protein HicB [Chitinophaga alhagiae]